MNPDPVDLRRVNWKEGLFLKPEHFRRQDAFAESLAVWIARYGTRLVGLVGGGPRDFADPAESFSLNRVSANAQNGATSVSVERVRGLTPAGAWIDIPTVLNGTVPTPDPDTQELLYVVRRRADGSFATGVSPSSAEGIELADAQYELTTRPDAHDIPWALVVGRLRRRADVTERDDSFVPACAFVSSHASLRDASASLYDRIAAFEDTYIALHERLREITILARRAAILLTDEYDDMLQVVEQFCTAIGDCALTLSDRRLPTQSFVGALAGLATRAERSLRITPSLEAYLRRTGLSAPWSDIRRRLTDDLRGDENLGDRIAAGRALCNALDGIVDGMNERCEDYRLHRRYRELELAIDRQTTPKQLFLRVALPVPVEAVSREDVRFRFTNLSLDDRLSYVAVLFGAGDEPLADRDYIADIFVNDKEQRRDVREAASRIRNAANLAVPVKGHGETIRDVVIKIPGGGPFSAAALYTLVSAATTETYRQARPEVTDTRPPEYVTLKLAGNKADRERKVALARSNQVRVRMFYDRPEDKGGKGTRRLFEVIITKGQVWSLRLSERDSKDRRLVCRWNETDSLMGMRPTYDFPELPRSFQLGLADVAKGPSWFLKCEFRHLREQQNGRTDDVIAARLQDVTAAWPLK